MKAESIMVMARGWGEGKKESNCLMGIGFQFYKIKRVMGIDGSIGYMYLILLN